MNKNSAHDPMVGSVLDDRYEILAKLARGGMATVYRARDTRLQRTVAVKIMRQDLGEDDEFEAKFDREARSAALINHPSVVSIFDQGTSQGQPYIVMEFIDGETLRRLIAREAPLKPLRALDLLEPLASALAAAHEYGIVHRDIKPENVLISARGQVKVADFGLARQTTSPQMTATGVLVGTASYLPPELVTHARPDSRSDIYSTGIVLFELLTGKKPHVGENNYQIAYNHVNVDVPAPSAKLRELGVPGFMPDYLDALVSACTARDPDTRIADGRELMSKLRQVRTELLRNPDRHNPTLAARLRPRPSDHEDVTQHIAPRPEPRPRPLTELPTTTIPQVSKRVQRVYDPDAITVPVQPRSPHSPEAAASPAATMPSQRGNPQPSSHRTPIFPQLSISHDPVHRRRRGMILLLLVLLITAIVGLSSWWWGHGRFTTTPDVVGTPREQAVKAMQANDLDFTTVDEYSEDVAAGSVIRTDPSGGMRAPRGSKVTLTISKGPERYAMPAVVGFTVDDARAAFESVQLKVGEVKEVWSAEAESGKIISTSEPAGAMLPPGTSVNLVVSKGPEPLKIKDFTGQSVDTAQRELTSLGFTVEVSEEHSTTVAEGMVSSQTPSSGTGKKGDTIKLVRSLGPEMVTVPDVRFHRTETARKTLEAAGFEVEVKPNPAFPIGAGLVSDTDPKAGSQAPKGSTITVYES